MRGEREQHIDNWWTGWNSQYNTLINNKDNKIRDKKAVNNTICPIKEKFILGKGLTKEELREYREFVALEYT